MKRVSLESEASSASNSGQWTIEQNKQILEHLKLENREAKAELSKRRVPPAREACRSQADKTVEKQEKAVHGMRRQYDKIMQEKKTALSRLSNLQDSVRDLVKASGGHPGGRGTGAAAVRPGSAVSQAAAAAATLSGPASREVRLLENRLEKAALKVNEAQSIQRTYEQVLDRMRQDQVAAEVRSRAVEDALRVAAKEHERLMISGKEAQHACDLAKEELLEFEERLRSERQRRARRLEEQRGQVALMQQANEALLQQQYPVQPEGGAQAAAPGLDYAQISEPSQAIQMLCRMAGCSSVSALLTALSTQQASSTNLSEMRALAEAQLLDLSSELAMERAHLEELRSGGRLTTQAQLDSAQVELREAGQAAGEARNRHDQVLRTHADVCAGLEHLASMVAALPAPPGQPPLTPSLADPELAVEVVAQCEQRLASAYRFILSIPKAAQLLQDMSSNPDFC